MSKGDEDCEDVPEKRLAITDYEVGYGKPPGHTRFRKGQSGNPKGRKKATNAKLTWQRLFDVVREEADRLVPGTTDSLQTSRAVVRSTMVHAMKGHGPSQKLAIALIKEADQRKAPEAQRLEIDFSRLTTRELQLMRDIRAKMRDEPDAEDSDP